MRAFLLALGLLAWLPAAQGETRAEAIESRIAPRDLEKARLQLPAGDPP